jgi:uncharacterized protein YecE (DUF72 family)
MAVLIGCGSWADPEYAGLLYPRGFPSDMRLSGYAMWFDHVEVNATYYSTPKKELVEKWVALTPPTFLFDIRLHRAFSQNPAKVAQDGRLLAYFLEGLEPIIRTRKFGTFLLVLSPSFSPERHRLQELDALVEKIQPYQLAVELRHKGWITREECASTLAFFHDRKITWVAVDMPHLNAPQLMPPLDEVTQPRLAYLRLHGRNPNYLKAKSAAERHTYAYSEGELQEIVKRIHDLSTKAKNVRVVANNHAHDFAPTTALALKHLLGQIWKSSNTATSSSDLDRSSAK